MEQMKLVPYGGGRDGQRAQQQLYFNESEPSHSDTKQKPTDNLLYSSKDFYNDPGQLMVVDQEPGAGPPGGEASHPNGPLRTKSNSVFAANAMARQAMLTHSQSQRSINHGQKSRNDIHGGANTAQRMAAGNHLLGGAVNIKGNPLVGTTSTSIQALRSGLTSRSRIFLGGGLEATDGGAPGSSMASNASPSCSGRNDVLSQKKASGVYRSHR